MRRRRSRLQACLGHRRRVEAEKERLIDGSDSQVLATIKRLQHNDDAWNAITFNALAIQFAKVCLPVSSASSVLS